MLISRKKGWYIIYDNSISVLGRIRFTLAHEFGHYLLHRTMADEFECGTNDFLISNSSIEKEANLFASYLLMPLDDYRNQIRREKISLDLFGHCSNRYGVSLTAVILKWLEFTSETALLVVSREDHVLWSFSSKKAFKRNIYFPCGSPLSNIVVEFINNHLKRKTINNLTVRLKAGAWHPTLDSEMSAIFSDQFEIDIFLVRFPFAELVEHEEESIIDTVDVLTNLSF